MAFCLTVSDTPPSLLTFSERLTILYAIPARYALHFVLVTSNRDAAEIIEWNYRQPVPPFAPL
ncbi:hypothetical protein CYLTODRAFT_89507 [Cylindrobasidium torrendii FP15055 ss-10]|uniref:Uncharacterized protein n=1 Tax=Cylindrobasidium torrendii FP15055 ss-10 TaxID=1314674 RepID=A0A0D7B270_9AGAR|nr:hypothetical protein CYLTODRAFT_89507 [Cylindrobasidium torrendii FP15055 ss-10]